MDLKKLKKVRLKTFGLSLIGPILIIGSAVVVLFTLDIMYAAIAGIVMLILLFGYSLVVMQPLLDKYKIAIFKEALNDLFKIDEYCFKSSLKVEYMTSKCLMTIDQKDTLETYNYLKCRYNDVYFHLADISILNGNATKKNKQNKIKNSGIWGIVEVPNLSSLELHIISKSKKNLDLIKWLEKEIKYKKVLTKLEKINTNFHLYSSNKDIKNIDDKLANAIMRLKESNKGDINFYIIDNKIHFVILNQQEPFEPELKKDIDKNKIENLKRKYKSIIQFIQVLF